MLVLRNVKIMEKGAVYHEEEQVHGGAGCFRSQASGSRSLITERRRLRNRI